MPSIMPRTPNHPNFLRRELLQAGSIGLLGLSWADVEALRASSTGKSRPRSVIFIFLTGGLAQHESFDMKPDAPDGVRGEFQPIATRTTGVQICEHLPMLAERSERWTLLRSLTHTNNDHDPAHLLVNAGRSQLPPAFQPKPYESPRNPPSIASVVNYALRSDDRLTPSVVLPFLMERPGNLAGEMGSTFDPWIVKAAECRGFGACPDCFQHEGKAHKHVDTPVFRSWNLSLPEGLSTARLEERRRLLSSIESQQRRLETSSGTGNWLKQREQVLNLLTSGETRDAFDIGLESAATLDRYGRNLFGWSLVLARRLVEACVGLVQVNLGPTSTWDTHGNAFPNLKDRLLPPMDRAVSALLDDLADRGLLDDTLVVMAGEFGRTPRISKGPTYQTPGRDHWGAVQSVLFAGGGVRGGQVIGASDRIGAFPTRQPQRPENLAATIYQALGIDRNAHWLDAERRPHPIYHDDPISDLFA